jgi:hypothetical protein
MEVVMERKLIEKDQVTYTWKITNVGYKLLGGVEKYADRITWECTGKCVVDGIEYTSSRSNTVEEQDFFRKPEPTKFINYEELTEEICFSWLFKTDFTRTSVQNQIYKSIEMQLYEEQKSVPWEK